MGAMVHRNKSQRHPEASGTVSKFDDGETPGNVIRRSMKSQFIHSDKTLACLCLEFKGNDWYVFVFTADDFSGELIDSPEGRLEWIPDENILDLNLWESDHIFMPWMQEGKFFSAKFEYNGDKMQGYDVVFHKP
jgi:8-oxo-dGTP diphosphatase